MKKIYVQPSVMLIMLNTCNILAGSPDVDPNATAGEGGWGAPQSKDSEFEDNF
ncbi:MAG: hypothetical protein IKO28_01395 [Prevotella sp.]|nr:hypothetical protein [Prevotella sp.]